MTSNSDFLRALAQGASKGTQLMVCAFPGDPANGNWSGWPYHVGTQHEATVDGWGELNTYFSVAGLRPVEGRISRKLAHFGGMLVLTVDDVTPDDLLSEPSYLIQTSPGKCQAGYFLDEACPDRLNLELVTMLVTSMIGKGLIKGDKSGNNVVRWVRLPRGQNQKSTGPFDHVLVKWHPQIRYSTEDAAACVGIELDELKERLAARPAGQRVRTGLFQDDDPVQRVAMLTRSILDGVDLHDAINQVAMHQIACGTPGGTVVNHLRTLMQVSAAPRDERWQARYDDIPRAVSSAEDKCQTVAPIHLAAPTEEVVEAAQQVIAARQAEQLIPEDLLNPGGMLQEMIDWQLRSAIKPQPTLALAAAISCLATALGRAVMGETGLRTNMMLVGVAGTGAGKEHGRTLVAKALVEAGMDRYLGGDEVASAPALLGRLVTQANTLIQPDEYGLGLQAARALSGGHKFELMTLQMKLFGIAHSTFRGTEYANRKEKPREDILHPCLHVHATTTLETLVPALGGSDMTSGFLNRILFFLAPEGRVKAHPVPPEAIPAELLAWLSAVNQLSPDGEVPGRAALHDNLNGQAPSVVKLSPPAKLQIADLYEWVDQQIEAGTKTGIAPLFSRVVEYAWKLAIVHCCSLVYHEDIVEKAMAGTLEVGLDSMDWAIRLVKHLVGSTERLIVDSMGENDFARQRSRAMKEFVKAGPLGLTHAQLAKAYKGYGDLKPRDQADLMESLVKAEQVVRVDFEPVSERAKGRKTWVAAEHAPAAPSEGVAI